MSDQEHSEFGPQCEINMPRPPRPHQLPTTEWQRPSLSTEEEGFDWLGCLVIGSVCLATVLGFILPI
jgi:hypothetical protein